jgi:hypothetical protein
MIDLLDESKDGKRAGFDTMQESKRYNEFTTLLMEELLGGWGRSCLLLYRRLEA